MKMNPKDILVPTVSLFIICLVATLLLGLVNGVTKDRIEEQAKEAAEAARQSVLTEADKFEPKSKDVEVVGENGEKTNETINYFEGKDDGSTIGYVFVSNVGSGYGGSVEVTVGIDLEGTITGIKVGDVSNETPGLGQNSAKQDFQDQFTGESGEITVDKGEPYETTPDGTISAITSATITSKAVTASVNDALSNFEMIGGEK